MRTRVAVGVLSALCSLLTVFYFLAIRSQVAYLRRGDALGAALLHGNKPPKYTGWVLADEDFTGSFDPKKARLMFFIMVAGVRELPGLDATLRSLYHVDHFFLIHMDVKANMKTRNDLKGRIARVIKERGHGRQNVRLVEPAMPITWGGFSMTLSAVYGLAQALHWTSKWDYFINLSASDLPLLPADEIADVLGEHKVANTSFIKGFKYQPSWEGYKFVDRREMFAEDQALLRDTEPERRWPWAILDSDKEMLTRPMPNLFTVYKGEFWVVLHRSMAEYVHKSPDNQARSLLTYFSGMMVSDEEFFQTVACNPHFPHETLRTHNDNLRFVNWWGDEASPAVVPPFRAVAAANSGAMFGRKFSMSTAEGRDGVKWVEEYLADSSRTRARVARVRRRLAESMGPRGEPVGFCGQAQVMHPGEAFFAEEGDEEKLSPEYEQPPPHRRGADEGDREGEQDSVVAGVDIRSGAVSGTESGDAQEGEGGGGVVGGGVSDGVAVPVGEAKTGAGVGEKQRWKAQGGKERDRLLLDARRLGVSGSELGSHFVGEGSSLPAAAVVVAGAARGEVVELSGDSGDGEGGWDPLRDQPLPPPPPPPPPPPGVGAASEAAVEQQGGHRRLLVEEVIPSAAA